MLAKNKFQKSLLSLLIPVALLSACGDSDDDVASTSTFSLAVSDAPVDNLSAVVVCFNEIQLKSSGDDIVFTVGDGEAIEANDLCLDSDEQVIPNTVGIDLMEYTGSDSINLVAGTVIEAGDYSQLRLVMSDGSYGIDSDTEEKIPVSVPSNELKLDGFSATVGGVVDFTLEFDLRKSMTNPVGQTGYFLKPRGVRLVDNSEVGHITGTVAETLLTDNQESHGCIFAPEDLTTSVASVYLYTGADLDIATLADNGGDEDNQPLASTTVAFDGAQTYNFEIGFVNAGDYTIAVSCDISDDPEGEDELVFIEAKNVTVIESNTAVEVTFGT